MIFTMNKQNLTLFFCFILIFSGFSLVSAFNPPSKLLSGLMSSSLTKLMKWVWSLKATSKIANSGRSMMKFESGYIVETVFDGSKLGIEPYAVELMPSGELLIVDSSNSNLYKISSSLSLYSRPKMVAGSAEGYSGHVDGKHWEAKLNHPKGAAVDDRGNIYVADTDNMAIRKISEAGVTTIAGGKWTSRGGHVDGPSDEAKFSNDFDVVYVGSSCSLLVIDRGNRAIREIQLHFDDCAYQYESTVPLGIAVLLAAGFFGYMLALLQRRVGSIVSSQNDVQVAENTVPSPYQKPLKSGKPLLGPAEDDTEKQEGFCGSLGKLITNAATSSIEIMGGVFPFFNPISKRKEGSNQYRNQAQYRQPNYWQSPESFVIPKEEEPPAIENRAPTPKKTYAFMSKDAEKMQQQLRQSSSRALYSVQDPEFQKQQKHQHRYQHQSSLPQTYYEQSCEKSKDIVFGAVQEGQHESVIRPTDYAMDSFNQQHIRFRGGYIQSFSSYT